MRKGVRRVWSLSSVALGSHRLIEFSRVGRGRQRFWNSRRTRLFFYSLRVWYKLVAAAGAFLWAENAVELFAGGIRGSGPPARILGSYFPAPAKQLPTIYCPLS